MWDRWYQNDIQNYIIKIIYLNHIVGIKGTAWRTALKTGLSNNILDQLSRWYQLITADEDFVSYLQSTGTEYEAYMGEKKLIGSIIENKLQYQKDKMTIKPFHS
jgi:hypothetical protein